MNKYFGLSGNIGYGMKHNTTNTRYALNAKCHADSVPKVSCKLATCPTTTPPVTPIHAENNESRDPKIKFKYGDGIKRKIIEMIKFLPPVSTAYLD